jgi:hypothetical protein
MEEGTGRVGNGISLRKSSAEYTRNLSVILQKKVLILRHSEVHGRDNSEAQNGMEWKYAEEFVLTDNQNNLSKQFVHTSKVVKCFRTEFREFASIFVPHNEIPSCFLFHGMVQNEISRVSFYFCYKGMEFRTFFSSAEWFGSEFREFSVPRNIRKSAGTNQLLFRL